jgi:hypothetical protein
MGDQAGRPFGAEAVLDARVGLDVDRHVVGERIAHRVDLAAVAPLRLDPEQAADIVWATNAAELYQLLVGQRGWSPQHYEHFLADAWRRLLLAD